MASWRRKLVVALPVLTVICIFIYLLRWTRLSPPQVQPHLAEKNTVNRIPMNEARLEKPYLLPGSVYIDGWASRGQALTRDNEFVRLVGDRGGMTGLIFTNLPLKAESFEINVTFRIHTTHKKKLFGDGLALWLLDNPAQNGPVFGIKDNFKGLGIMIDTFRNDNRGTFPFINVMMGDGSASYNKGLDGSDNRLDGCVAAGIVNPSNKKSQLRVRYLQSSHLQIDLDANGDGKWKNCVTRMGVKLPGTKYLGFSAETGQLSHAVDILECHAEALVMSDGSFLVSSEEWESSTEPITGDQEKLKQRKLTQRMRARERKVKKEAEARRLERYGDPQLTFVRRAQKAVIRLLVMCGIITILAAMSWMGWLFYRTWRQSRRRPGGLLD